MILQGLCMSNDITDFTIKRSVAIINIIVYKNINTTIEQCCVIVFWASFLV